MKTIFDEISIYLRVSPLICLNELFLNFEISFVDGKIEFSLSKRILFEKFFIQIEIMLDFKQ